MKALLLAVLLGSAVLSAAGNDFKLKADPRIGQSPQDFHIQATIEPKDANRSACVIVDGPTYRSTCWELHPTDRRVWDFWLKGFRGGRYDVVLVVVRLVDGQRVELHTPAQSICVIGSLTEGDVSCGVETGGAGLQD